MSCLSVHMQKEDEEYTHHNTANSPNKLHILQNQTLHMPPFAIPPIKPLFHTRNLVISHFVRVVEEGDDAREWITNQYGGSLYL